MRLSFATSFSKRKNQVRGDRLVACGSNKLTVRLLAAVLALSTHLAVAAEIRVAVASNFQPAMLALNQQFESGSDHRLTLIFGATGKHYAQIVNGAPFDVFLAADAERPRRLEQESLAVAGTRFTYALGKLVLWSPRSGYVDAQGRVLEHSDFRHLAIANPRLAPYGLAARQVLQALGLWQRLNERLVQGENIGQAYQFVESGNAELGFLAWSQVQGPNVPATGSLWLVPQQLYQPIEQQAVLLRDTAAGRALLRFLRSPQALKIIADHGYAVP
jgi:molybdate transport system substrate-binding protein